MGDASSTTEKRILYKYNLPDIDVLQVGHHSPQSAFIYNGIICEENFENQDYESKFEYRKHPIYLSREK